MRPLWISFLLFSICTANVIDQYNQQVKTVYRQLTGSKHDPKEYLSFIHSFPYSKSTFDALKMYYQHQREEAINFIDGQPKTICLIKQYREINQNYYVNEYELPSPNISDLLVEKFEFINNLSPNICRVEVSDKDENVSSDIIISIETDIYRPREGQSLFELTTKLSMFIPDVYQDEPVGQYIYKNTYFDPAPVPEIVTQRIFEDVEQTLFWESLPDGLLLLTGTSNEQLYDRLDSRLDKSPDNLFLIKLLNLSPHRDLQQVLIDQGQVEGIWRSRMFYPWSKELGEQLAELSDRIFDYRERILLVKMAYAMGAINITEQLNSVLADMDDYQYISDIAPLLYAAIDTGNDETLSLLQTMKYEIEYSYEDIDETFLSLLNYTIKNLEKKYPDV